MKNYIVYFHGSVVVQAESETGAEELAYGKFPLADGDMEFTITSSNEVKESI